MSDPTGYSESELRIARVLYHVLREHKGDLVRGSPENGEYTLVDGTIDLREIARKILSFGSA
jgi:hypothetical protein